MSPPISTFHFADYSESLEFQSVLSPLKLFLVLGQFLLVSKFLLGFRRAYLILY
jgi:hypothetical protein